MAALTITIIQTDLLWENKEENLQMLEQKINGIVDKTEIVVLPEMFSTGFSMQPTLLAETMDGNTMQWMKKVSASKRVVLTGSIIITENNQYYNRLIWMLPNGEYGYYDKRHLFSYAGEDKYYTAGSKRLIASVKEWKINLQVCYDLRFPVWARQTPGNEPVYDILLYVANWPQKRSHAWKTLLNARAIENQCFVIGVNRIGTDGNNQYHSGDSLVVSPLGEVLYYAADKQDIFTITLQKETLQHVRDNFPFANDADKFTLGF